VDLYRLVRSIPWWERGGVLDETNRVSLTIDAAREGEIVEAWIPVLLSDEGEGVLVWGNSD
jgi:hypothetical protein